MEYEQKPKSFDFPFAFDSLVFFFSGPRMILCQPKLANFKYLFSSLVMYAVVSITRRTVLTHNLKTGYDE